MLYYLDISILKNLWTKDPVLSFHTEPHNYIAVPRHHIKLQSTALLPPLKYIYIYIYIYIVCICPILAKEVLFSKRINTNVRINISLYLESINFSIYLLLGFIYFIFLNFYLFIFGCAGFSFL